jgi:cysteine synthase A
MMRLKADFDLLAKAEFLNPTGSIKDRAAFFMISDAMNKGVLKRNDTIVEPTSGNTGIGLAFVAKMFGINVVLIMPDFISKEKQSFLKMLGVHVILTDGDRGMKGAFDYASQTAINKGFTFLNQFENQSNILAHEITTAPEILKQSNFEIDAFVAGVGTGGTLTGIGRALKKFNPHIKVSAVEPEESAVLSGKRAGYHTIEGIGAGFIPKLLDRNIIDGVVIVSSKQAWHESKKILNDEGVFVGPSSGANVLAVKKIHEQYGFKRIVTVLPDRGERYLSEFLKL